MLKKSFDLHFWFGQRRTRLILFLTNLLACLGAVKRVSSANHSVGTFLRPLHSEFICANRPKSRVGGSTGWMSSMRREDETAILHGHSVIEAYLVDKPSGCLAR
jgi:hypothetical protein